MTGLVLESVAEFAINDKTIPPYNEGISITKFSSFRGLRDDSTFASRWSADAQIDSVCHDMLKDTDSVRFIAPDIVSEAECIILCIAVMVTESKDGEEDCMAEKTFQIIVKRATISRGLSIANQMLNLGVKHNINIREHFSYTGIPIYMLSSSDDTIAKVATSISSNTFSDDTIAKVATSISSNTLTPVAEGTTTITVAASTTIPSQPITQNFQVTVRTGPTPDEIKTEINTMNKKIAPTLVQAVTAGIIASGWQSY